MPPTTRERNATCTRCSVVFELGPRTPWALRCPPCRVANDRERPGTTRARRSRPRARTIPIRKLTRSVLKAHAFATTLVDTSDRPKTRGECRGHEGPCPWVGCKHHLYLDINPETGTIKLNFPDLEPWELEHTCALDVAEDGSLTLEEVGQIMNLTRERTRQIEVRGLINLRRSPRALSLTGDERAPTEAA
jgi:hypothetical protein